MNGMYFSSTISPILTTIGAFPLAEEPPYSLSSLAGASVLGSVTTELSSAGCSSSLSFHSSSSTTTGASVEVSLAGGWSSVYCSSWVWLPWPYWVSLPSWLSDTSERLVLFPDVWLPSSYVVTFVSGVVSVELSYGYSAGASVELVLLLLFSCGASVVWFCSVSLVYGGTSVV